MANAALNSTSVPLGSGLPASLQGFIDAVAQYVTLSGLDDVAGIVVSQDTPDCTESSLKQHMSNLRKKLRDAGAGDCIQSVWGIGFLLGAPKS